MTRKLLLLCAALLVVGVSQVHATTFCWDNTDTLIVKLKKLELTTEQLDDVFAYQREHRDLIASSHRDGRGCRFHENHEVEFEKASIGVLDDSQFQKLKGRQRNETEGLRYDKYLLTNQIEQLKAQLDAVRAQLAALKAQR